MDVAVKDCAANLVQTGDDMQRCLNAIRQANILVYDVETSGLNPRKNHIVGYVLTVGARPDETFYVPVRHGGGGNCLDHPGLRAADDDTVPTHPFEFELQIIASRHTVKTIVGHNLVFDLLFSARRGITFAGRTECTQVAMALINEFLPSFSLDSCARYMRVTEKLGLELYQHLYTKFREKEEFADKKMMAHFWKLAGNDPIGVDYACGDGVSTWELRKAQQIELDLQELNTVWDVECRVTKTLFRMQHRGIPISPANLEWAMTRMEDLITEAKSHLPPGLNVRSGPQMKALFEKAGITDYPTTTIGNPSFTEDWLETNELGQKVIALRKVTNLMNSFINPVVETHMFNGRIFPSYAQLGADEYGTVTGRLSSYAPNIQQVPKRNKKLGRIFRKIFVPDDGFTWGSNDFSQCEPRLYAEYSGSPMMIKGYTSDPPVDFYQMLSNITGKPRSPTAGIAGNCKQLALSIFYGAGDERTAEMLGIPLGEARELRAMVRQMVPEIHDFANRAKIRANQRGYVKTVLGRRARFERGQFTYKAGGRIIQGGNADLIKLSLVNVDDYLASINCPPPFATIHDSIEVQFPEGRQDINKEVVRIMEATAQEPPIAFPNVPQVVDNGVGPDWSVATYGAEE